MQTLKHNSNSLQEQPNNDIIAADIHTVMQDTTTVSPSDSNLKQSSDDVTAGITLPVS